MVVLSVVFLTPLVVMVLGSLQRPLQPPPDGLDLWPDPVTWSNYGTVDAFMPLVRLLLNSALLVVVGAAPYSAAYTQAIREAAAGDPRIRLLSQPNAGKSRALNHGLTTTLADVVVTVDADTLVTPSTVGNLVRRFDEDGAR